MGKQRVEYIDYVRGLCVAWVVWFHTTHPDFVSYPFRIPLFFFASGVFFKPYPWPVFWRKKLNQLIIPFIFFYLIYYVFYIVTNALRLHSFANFDYSCFWELFDMHSNTQNFTINPPLWFILALLNLQLILYISSRLLTRRWLLMLFAIVVTIAGDTYFLHKPTLFMFGRSLQYFIYYVAGYSFGRDLISALENARHKKIATIALGACLLLAGFAIPSLTAEIHIMHLMKYVQVFGIIILMIILFKYICRFPPLYPLKFFGLNSYVVFGMHEIYHTSFRIFLEKYFGEITIELGIIQTILTLLLLWPTILLFNKYIPFLVGKREVLQIPKY